MSHEESFRQLLKPIAEKQKYKNYNLLIKEISSEGANYTSKLFAVTVSERGKEDLHLFVKVGCNGEKFRNKIEALKIYTTERFFYTQLSEIYKKIEDECGILDEYRLSFAKCYGYDTTIYKETIILENLVTQGWRSYDRFKSVDWAYATAAVNEMAKFHALSFAYAKKDLDKFNQIKEYIHFRYVGEAIDTLIKDSGAKALEKVKQDNKKALQEFWQEYEPLFAKFNEPMKHNVIIHGDYRPSNLMHKVKEDGTVDIKIVDLQTMQCSSPIVDLLYFIFTGSDEEFRAQHYDNLIDYYFTQLQAALKRLDLDPDQVFPRSDFDEELKERLPFGLTIAIFALPIVTVDVENAPKVDEDLDLTNFSVSKTSDLYTERLNGVVNDYVKWGILKSDNSTEQ